MSVSSDPHRWLLTFYAQLRSHDGFATFAPSIQFEQLRELEARVRAIDNEMRSLRPVPRLAPAVVEDRLAEWRRLLRSSTTQGRTVLQRILRGRITFTLRTNPVTGEVDGYDFEAPTRFDKLFTGIAVERPAGVDEGPLGTEWITAEDTFDGDYGRLLEQVYVKGVASPRGHEECRRLEPVTTVEGIAA